MSEQLTAAGMVKLLNRYFTVVAEQIRAHNGILEKYIGDAVMAFWTPPFSRGDEHAASGCLAALAYLDAVNALRPELPHILGLRRNIPDLKLRMGHGHGRGRGGNDRRANRQVVRGHRRRHQPRVAPRGREQGLRHHGDPRRGDASARPVRDRGARAGHGRRRRQDASRSGSSSCSAGPTRSWRRRSRSAASTREGLAAYRAQDWDTAERRFSECLRVRPDDGPAGVLEGPDRRVPGRAAGARLGRRVAARREVGRRRAATPALGRIAYTLGRPSPPMKGATP